MDLFIEFHIAYFHQGTYITHRFSIAKNYFLTGFFFDFTPLLMIYLATFIPGVRDNSYVHYLFYLKFYSVLIIDKRIRDRLQLMRKYY
jgi:hypothetical protein